VREVDATRIKRFALCSDNRGNIREKSFLSIAEALSTENASRDVFAENPHGEIVRANMRCYQV
jgi:hypothetical protein